MIESNVVFDVLSGIPKRVDTPTLSGNTITLHVEFFGVTAAAQEGGLRRVQRAERILRQRCYDRTEKSHRGTLNG